MKKINKLEKQVAPAYNYCAADQGLQDNSHNVSTAAAAVADGWTALSDDITALGYNYPRGGYHFANSMQLTTIGVRGCKA